MFRRLPFWVLLLASASFAGPPECPRLLPRLLERISPLAAGQRGYLTGARLSGRPVLTSAEKLPERSWSSFLERLVGGHNDRIFLVFTPSGPEARVATGHLSLFIRDTLFNRVTDDLGPAALSSHQRSLAELVLWSWVQPDPGEIFRSPHFEIPYAVVHEVDVSPQSSQTLHRFFHDRVWFHNAGDPAYRRPYDPLPFSRPQHPQSENCVSFAFSFLDPYWIHRHPQLEEVASEIGETWVDEIPLRQAQLLMSHPKRRASYWIRFTKAHPGIPARDQFSSLIP